jgi:hypothetical protein
MHRARVTVDAANMGCVVTEALPRSMMVAGNAPLSLNLYELILRNETRIAVSLRLAPGC